MDGSKLMDGSEWKGVQIFGREVSFGYAPGGATGVLVGANRLFRVLDFVPQVAGF